MKQELKIGVLARALSTGIVEKGYSKRKYACFIPGMFEDLQFY